ncbi:hypothetical protein V8E54_004249 [Elaphomyces granulatus]
MLLFRRVFISDEELGKKDDDHRPVDGRGKGPALLKWRFPRRRRLLFGIIGAYLLFVFFKNMPTDLQPAIARYDPRFSRPQKGSQALSPNQSSIPSQPEDTRREDTGSEMGKYYYDGEIRHPWLLKSLYSVRVLDEHSHVVLFAASNLQSVSDLLPLACEMARQGMNRIHFAVMGRDDLSIEGIQQLNSIRDDDCPMNWHDGRPSHAPYSTDPRMEKSVTSALDYIKALLHPQVIIAHSSPREDSFFWKAVNTRTHDMNTVLIDLPSSARDLMWLSKLDSNSLKYWNKVHIEIVIRAPSESSGSLIRLLKLLERADYLGSMPSLTIELPLHPDPLLHRFLQKTRWPPLTTGAVTLRHYVQPHRLTPVESTIRTVESFYPADPSTCHVLILSPQAELSPSFFHYLKYIVLRYKYSTFAMKESAQLLGVSLELPSSYPTDDTPFSKPSSRSDAPFFRWQIPNSNAALYFGDKWVEMHSFLSNHLVARRSPSDVARGKIISKKFPAFMEYVLELMRVRGYYILYPSFSDKNGLASIHNELYQPPEEFTLVDSAEPPQPEDQNLELGSIERPVFQASTLTALLHKLPMVLPDISSLPLLSYNGERLDSQMSTHEAREYARNFRTTVGGCETDVIGDGEIDQLNADDLFCLEA